MMDKPDLDLRETCKLRLKVEKCAELWEKARAGGIWSEAFRDWSKYCQACERCSES